MQEKNVKIKYLLNEDNEGKVSNIQKTSFFTPRL